jgi:hypothetical protein
MHDATSGQRKWGRKGTGDRHWYLDLTLWCWIRVFPHFAFGNVSYPYLAMCISAISAHFTRRLLVDVCGLDHCPIYLSPSRRAQSKLGCETGRLACVLTIRRNREDFSPTVDSVVDKFTYTVVGYSELPIPRSSTKPRRVPVPSWTKECRDALRARIRALRNFRWNHTEANLITFKRLWARAQITVRQFKRH